MNSRVTGRASQQEPPGDLPESEERWTSLLQKVIDEQRTDDPWYIKLGISLLWALGIALAAGILAALILAIRALFSANLQFTFYGLSNHIFWTAALLMIAGMVAPASTELDRSEAKKTPVERPRSLQERRTRALERRMRRVYDPWRWRIWGGAVLTFGLAILSGLLSKP